MYKDTTDYSYLYNWEDSVENFDIWIQEACGFGEGTKEYDQTMKVIKTQSELDEWIQHFNGDLGSILDTTTRYNQSKFN